MSYDYEKSIRVFEDFPIKGISFKDISTFLADKEAFKHAIDEMVELIAPYKPDYIVGPESRGFIFAAPLAYALGCGFVVARKPGKLPGEVVSATYKLEYGTDSLEIPAFALEKGKKAVLVDDLLATGGTLSAIAGVLTSHGVEVPLAVCLIELEDLKGRDALPIPFVSLLKYPH
ncbi:MAG: adenine phosphoribosyltransferase [Bacillota bacterium]|nr:adenine phosphoribosyltransferase [Bacillota bacterium]